MIENRSNINSWKKFSRIVRARGCSLLKRLDGFPDSILVTGCQRSGTTILSRIITQSDGMVNYWFGKDDELDAALILSGEVEHVPHGRYCFQTTYLNECYREYLKYQNGHRIIWVLRNPYSVVYSMLYNWRKFALDELFLSCGLSLVNKREKQRYNLVGKYGITRLYRACYAYAGKTRQALELNRELPAGAILFIEYDELVKNKETVLPMIYKFIGLIYKEEYAGRLHLKSLDRAKKLSDSAGESIRRICEPVYQDGLALLKTSYALPQRAQR